MKAFAKLNLSLLVRPRDASGLHPIHSLAQSIDWADEVTLADAEEDALQVDDPGLVDRDHNLAWQAVEAVRRLAGDDRPVSLGVTKRIPVGAGLGGGSADAAAALVLSAHHLGIEESRLDPIAPGLGADVPFCLAGGTALVEGLGDRVTPLPALEGLHVAVVVPPFHLDTAAVYGKWDELESPQGEAVDARFLPPRLREGDPIRNDLVPAAAALEPRLGDWLADTSREWGQPALMTGSGPALFAFFPTGTEAAGAAAAIGGARAARGCVSVPRGWE